jgi:hypothetical protein
MKITNEELERKIIFKSVKIGYKRGFLDGMNFESDDIILEKEFDKMPLSKFIDKEAEKVFKELEKELKQ